MGKPGLQSMTSDLMKKTLHDREVASIDELRELCLEAEARRMAGQMTVERFV